MWTNPGGFFIVHLVEPDKYDPLLDLASPFAAFSLQKYSYDRQQNQKSSLMISSMLELFRKRKTKKMLHSQK